MTDYTELQAELEAKKAAGWQCTDGLSIDTVLTLIAENESAHKHWQNESNNVQVLVAEVAWLKANNEALRKVLAGSHEFILNDARTRRMCDEAGQVSPLFPKRVGILAAIDAAMGKGEQP